MTRDKFCTTLANHISEIVNKKVCYTEVSEQLMLIELNMKPTNKLIGTYIKEFSSLKQ